MDIEVWRFSSQRDSTLGLLFFRSPGERVFQCFTLEDEARTVKVFGETRIPAGKYRLKLRTFGRHHEHYQSLFPDLHKGMVEVLSVPGFTDILLHVGNTDEDTAGCLLCGNIAYQNVTMPGRLQNSLDAYKRVYPRIAEAILQGETWAYYIDWDYPTTLETP